MGPKKSDKAAALKVTAEDRKPLDPVPPLEDVASLSTKTVVPKELFRAWDDEDLEKEDWYSTENPFQDTAVYPILDEEVVWKRPSEFMTPLEETVVVEKGKGKAAKDKAEFQGPKFAHMVIPVPVNVEDEEEPTPPVTTIERRIPRDFQRIWSVRQLDLFTKWQNEELRIEHERAADETAHLVYEEALQRRNDQSGGSDVELSDTEMFEDDGDDEDDTTTGNFDEKDFILNQLRPGNVKIEGNPVEKPTIPDGDYVDKTLATYFELIEASRHLLTESNQYFWEAIYPQNEHRVPIYNPGGKYCVKLFVHGKWRKVVVDDRLPLDAEGNVRILSSSDPKELWPSILAKALYKVLSSNSCIGTDRQSSCCVTALTGWKTCPLGDLSNGCSDDERILMVQATRAMDDKECCAFPGQVFLAERESDITLVLKGDRRSWTLSLDQILAYEMHATTVFTDVSLPNEDLLDASWTQSTLKDGESVIWQRPTVNGPTYLHIDATAIEATTETEVLLTLDISRNQNDQQNDSVEIMLIEYRYGDSDPAKVHRFSTDNHGVLKFQVESGKKHSYRLRILDSCGYVLSSASKAAVSFLEIQQWWTTIREHKVCEIVREYSAFRNQEWTMLFRHQFTVPGTEEVPVDIHVHVPEEEIARYVSICVVDNDTGSMNQLPLLEGQVTLKPNENGYMLIGSCQYNTADVPPGTVRILLGSTVDLTHEAIPTTLTTYELNYNPNNLDCCCRDVFRVTTTGEIPNITLRTISKYPSAVVKIEILDPSSLNAIATSSGQSNTHIWRVPNPESGVVVGKKDAEVEYIVQLSFDTNHWMVPNDLQSKRPFYASFMNHDNVDETLKWTLDVWSNGSSVSLSPDVTKETKEANIKQAWENAQPGREALATVSRLLYLGQVDYAKEVMKDTLSPEDQAKMLQRFERSQKYGSRDDCVLESIRGPEKQSSYEDLEAQSVEIRRLAEESDRLAELRQTERQEAQEARQVAQEAERQDWIQWYKEIEETYKEFHTTRESALVN